MSIGIYKIQNKINGHIYIGQSKNIEARIRSHINSSFNNNDKDYNMIIHKAIRKYGEKNFTYEIVEECLLSELNEKEIYWINYYNSFHNGYNATTGGDSSYLKKGKEVELYDFDGNYIKSYPSVSIAAKELGVGAATIYSILKGERLSTKNYQFKYKEDTTTTISKYSNRQGGKKKVYQYDDDNNLINIFESAAQASRELGIDSSTIIKVCKGKLKHCGGYKWSYNFI